MASQLQPVRGTHDLLPDSYAQHHRVIESASEVARLYGFARMDTPIFEFSEVFHRAVGDTSDIVTKETYTFTDRGGESITLRPEFTAAIVRSFISNGLQQNLPFKAFYAGPAFRYERPQKGRLRQFHQIGAELLGAAEPMADVELIALGMHTLRVLGLSDSVVLEINSLGDVESRAAYRDALVAYLSKHADKLSDDSRLRLERNPLRILDSKNEGDRDVLEDAPILHDYFTPASAQHFAAVNAGLERAGHCLSPSAISWCVASIITRTRCLKSPPISWVRTGTVLAGGRYDGLVKLMGGQDVPGIGFAAGVERLVALMGEENAAASPKPVAAIIPMGEAAEVEGWKLASTLRAAGIAADIAYKGNAKKRFERANKTGAAYAVILGEDELKNGTVTLKNLQTGEQESCPREQVTEKLKAHVL
jgi:histidyl-tRNA synthetase